MKIIIASFLTALLFSILPSLFQFKAIRQDFGLCAHVQNGDLDNERKRDLFQATWAQWIRTDWTWDETRNRELINWARSHSIKVLGILDHQTMNFSRGFKLNDWAKAVNRTVRLYPEVDVGNMERTK